MWVLFPNSQDDATALSGSRTEANGRIISTRQIRAILFSSTGTTKVPLARRTDWQIMSVSLRKSRTEKSTPLKETQATVVPKDNMLSVIMKYSDLEYRRIKMHMATRSYLRVANFFVFSVRNSDFCY